MTRNAFVLFMMCNFWSIPCGLAVICNFKTQLCLNRSNMWIKSWRFSTVLLYVDTIIGFVRTYKINGTKDWSYFLTYTFRCQTSSYLSSGWGWAALKNNFWHTFLLNSNQLQPLWFDDSVAPLKATTAT